VIYFLPLARYSLFVLKVLLTTKQNKTIMSDQFKEGDITLSPVVEVVSSILHKYIEIRSVFYATEVIRCRVFAFIASFIGYYVVQVLLCNQICISITSYCVRSNRLIA